MAANAALTVVSGNVYDVGKFSKSDDAYIEFIEGEVPADSNLCWAAASSNVIQYWQDTYYKKGEEIPNGIVPFGYTAPNGTGCLEVYREFVSKWYNTGGSSLNAITWWMQGRGWGTNGNYYSDGSSQRNPAISFGTYYTDIFGDYTKIPSYPSTAGAAFYSAKMCVQPGTQIEPKFDDIQATIKKAFEHDAQAVVLDLTASTGIGHSITCWGYEMNEAGDITTLILSDSDDKKYGTFMVSLTKNEDGKACIGTDRSRSDYQGNHVIADAVFINTPNGAARTEQTSITSLDSEVTSSGRLSKSATTSKDVVIGGGTYSNSDVVQAVLFTSKEDASISITGGQMQIKDGAMALLYGGLTVKNTLGSGVVADGHLYVHGGAVDVEGCISTENGGGIQATDTYGKDLFAVAYVEMKEAGDVNISSNTSSTQARRHLGDGIYEYQNAGGGAVYSADSLSIRDSGKVTIENNKAKGYNVHGGGTFAQFNTIIDGNGDVSVSGNSTASENGYLSYGGGIAGMYIDVSQNQVVDFSGNSVSIENSNAKGWVGVNEERTMNIYEGGASAAGGAIAVHPYAHLSYYEYDGKQYKLVAVPTTLSMDENSSVTFESNTISVKYTGDISMDYGINNQPCFARGGAVYLGNDVVDGTYVGTEASISRNQGNVTFSKNHADSKATVTKEDKAQGGAVYISTASSLTIDSNKGQVSFTENSVTGTVSQGGAIYNEGNLQITKNGAVEFSDNTAAEGSHLYNAAGATAEIAWNGSVLFSGETEDTSTVVNKGTMYLAAEAGQSIEFHNTTLDTTEGMLHLGRDAADKKHATTLSFTGDESGQTPAPRTDVSSLSGLPTELSGLSLSFNSISSKQGGDKVSVDDLNVSTDTDLVVNGLVLGSNVQLAERDKAHALTLSNVVVDLGKTKCTVQENERGGKNYIFDLQSMLSGNITLSGITFDASSFLEPLDFINKDSVCMMFGDVDFSQKEGSSITLAYVGWSTQSGGYVMDGSNVYFGAYFEVPEPATGTLSLLALTLLAARRRRK